MSELPVLYLDESKESTLTRDELIRRKVRFVPLVVKNPNTRLPALRTGRHFIVGFGDIALYFLRARP